MDFDALPLELLQRRRSLKWRTYERDVLPVWVAELDVPLVPAVRAVLQQALDDGDTGYAEPNDLRRAFCDFALRRWDWFVDPSTCWPVADVMVGVGEALEALTEPGDGVVICTPVYQPFFSVPAEHGRTTVQVPLRGRDLDLEGIDAALAAGARAVLLCSPHNPLGRVWTGAELDDLHRIAVARGTFVISDEIHAPLTLPGSPFTPYLRGRTSRAVAVVSASKAFNLAGLKAALVVSGDDRVQERLAAMSVGVGHRLGHLGVLAGVAAYDEGDQWLDGLVRHLDRNRALLQELLARDLPEIEVSPPEASYLCWLDCRGISGSPGALFLERGRVALVDGSEFGGPGFARFNYGTTKAVLEEAVRRMAQAVAG